MKLSCLSRLVRAAIALNDSLTFTPFYGIIVGDFLSDIKGPICRCKIQYVLVIFSYYKFLPLFFFFFFFF